jgi:hypothetical protein
LQLHTVCRNVVTFRSGSLRIGFSKRYLDDDEKTGEAVGLLIAKMADINSRNNAKETAMDLAIKHQQFVSDIDDAGGERSQPRNVSP